MHTIKVLFFSADPLSAPPDGRHPRLLLDEDVRQIRQKVRAAEHRDALEFDFRLAARTDDLLQALNEVCPQVVHFSGHGEAEGLVLVGRDGRRPHVVEAAALAQLFETFRGDIRLVVLNACFSLPQAEAIAASVGCAIGTRSAISDQAAITFGAAFYRAVAFGLSVQAAFDQARAQLALDHFAERDCPALVARPDVDPAELVLVPDGDADADESADESEPRTAAAPEAAPPRRDRDPRRRARWLGVAAPMIVGAVLAAAILIDDPAVEAVSPKCVLRGAALPVAAAPAPVARSTRLANTAGTADEVAAARDLYQAGDHAAAFLRFQRAAEEGNHEAMGFLGIMYMCGEGTAPQRDLAVVWLHRAAEARDVRGMNALALAYQEGEGVRQSDRWARHWYRVAAEEKHSVEAMRNLAGLERERGSDEQALAWIESAVRAGSVDAMVDAGEMHENGWGTPRNPEEALRLYRAAAQARSPRGMFAVGRAYQDGVGVVQDHAKASAWYRKGATAGSADAMNNLGYLYYRGLGVQEDRAEAIRWFRQAAAAGSATAAANLAILQAH